MKKTYIKTSTQEYVNKIALPDDWTGAEGEWQLPPGHEFVDGIGREGSVWNGSSFDHAPPPTPPTLDEIYDEMIASQTDIKRAFKALVLCLINGEITNGMTVADAKDAIKARM